MKDHVSAHGAEDPKDFKGRRRLQSTLGRTVSYLRQEDKEERKAAFLEPHSHWAMGMWVCPLNSFGPYHGIPGRG